jgi:hypothetical protein
MYKLELNNLEPMKIEKRTKKNSINIYKSSARDFISMPGTI